jgi:uncharacterized membrane protein
MGREKVAGLAFVFAWFFGGGIGHFVATAFFVSIVPPWVPDARLAVYVVGGFEIALALSLLSARLRPLAGIALLLLIVCVTPANIYMLQHHELFPAIPVAVLWIRLPIQLALMACVWWSTRPEAASAA